MNKDENEKFDIMVGEPKEEVELGKNFEVKFCLYLYDKNKELIKQASRVNDGTKATLKAFITKNGNEFPDKTSEFTYHLGEIGNYQHTPEGKYIITANSQEEKKILNRINNINGKLITEHFGDKIGGDGHSLEGSDDIKFKIASDLAAGRGIRVDIYNCPNNSPITAGQKPIQRIAGERIQIDLIWNRRIQLNLKEDVLKFVAPPPTSKRKWEWWQITLVIGVSALVILGIVFLIFHRQIKDWWRKRKNKKEDQLEVF